MKKIVYLSFWVLVAVFGTAVSVAAGAGSLDGKVRIVAAEGARSDVSSGGGESRCRLEGDVLRRGGESGGVLFSDGVGRERASAIVSRSQNSNQLQISRVSTGLLILARCFAAGFEEENPSLSPSFERSVPPIFRMCRSLQVRAGPAVGAAVA